MELDLETLRHISDHIFLSLKERGISSVTVPVDYYWHIHKSEIYNPYEKPSELSIGQLSEDMVELDKIIKTNREPIGYDLVLLSTVLRAVGEHVVG